MANWYSDQIALGNIQPTLGGLAGAPHQPKQTEVRGGIEVWHFTFTQGTTATVAINDTIDLAYLKPESRIYALFYTFTAAGAGATFSVGKYDPNNPSGATTDPIHYFNATNIAAAGNSGVLTSNLGEQVGLTNLGDLSTGNLPPMFGGAPIIIRGTFAGAVPAGGTVINGYLFVAEGQGA